MKTVTDKQRIAATVIAAGGLCKQAAESAGVSPETISVWRRATEFQSYVNSLRNEAHDAARNYLRMCSLDAIEALRELIRTAKSEETRRKAATDVLTLMGHGNVRDYYSEVWSESV